MTTTMDRRNKPKVAPTVLFPRSIKIDFKHFAVVLAFCIPFSQSFTMQWDHIPFQSPMRRIKSSPSHHRTILAALNFYDPTDNATPELPAVTGGGGGRSTPLRKKKLQTFPRYLEVECWKLPHLRGLEPVLQAVAEACKQINRIVQRAQTDDVYGVALDTNGQPLQVTNIQGEVQQKLDVLCNTIMMRAFCGSGRDIAAVASEEEDEPRCCADVMKDNAFAVGDFVATFDPIDGSKNIDASLPVGTIFGIYRKSPGDSVVEASFLQDGRSLVASGYCLYS